MWHHIRKFHDVLDRREACPHIPRWTVPSNIIVAVSLLKVLVFLAACIWLAGCSVVPTNNGSRAAEVVWQGLHAIDTAQTVQIARNPACFRENNPLASAAYGTDHPSTKRVLLTNVLGSLLHARVSRWLDDRTERALASDSDTRGAWYVGRIAWHAVSIGASAYAVSNNYSIGLRPNGADCQ